MATHSSVLAWRIPGTGEPGVAPPRITARAALGPGAALTLVMPLGTGGYAMDCSLPGSSIHGIFQARVLEWGAIAFSVIVSSN